jgi:hypothetical protein
MSSLQLRARAALRKGHGRWLIPPWIAPAFLFCAIVLLPWTAFLFFALPRHYVANHWQFAWGGFDIGLGLALAATAVAVARRSPFAEVTAAGHRDAARLRRVVRCPHLSRNERRRSGRGRGSARRASDCRVVFLDGNEPRARSRGRAPLPPGGRIHDRRESSRPAAGRHGTVTESTTTSRTAPWTSASCVCAQRWSSGWMWSPARCFAIRFPSRSPLGASRRSRSGRVRSAQLDFACRRR